MKTDLASDSIVHDLIILGGIRPARQIHVEAKSKFKSLCQSKGQFVRSLAEVVNLKTDLKGDILPKSLIECEQDDKTTDIFDDIECERDVKEMFKPCWFARS